MGQIEASLLALFALSAATGCNRSDANSRARSRADDQATIVINGHRSSQEPETGQAQTPDPPPPRDQAQTIVIEPHAALEPAKVESIVTPIELVPPKPPAPPRASATVGPTSASQASAAAGRAAPLDGVVSPSADNADLSAVVNELGDLLRDLTGPGGKAAPDSPLMNSIQSGKAPRPTTPPGEGR